MMDHNIRFKGALWEIIPKLSLLPLLIWSSDCLYYYYYYYYYYYCSGSIRVVAVVVVVVEVVIAIVVLSCVSFFLVTYRCLSKKIQYNHNDINLFRALRKWTKIVFGIRLLAFRYTDVGVVSVVQELSDLGL